MSCPELTIDTSVWPRVSWIENPTFPRVGVWKGIREHVADRSSEHQTIPNDESITLNGDSYEFLLGNSLVEIDKLLNFWRCLEYLLVWHARVLLTCPMCSSLLKSRPRALHWAFDSRTLRNGCSHRLLQNSMNTSMDLINSVLEGL